MTRDEAVEDIAKGLGYRRGMEGEIGLALRQVQRSLENGSFLPWFLLVSEHSVQTRAGEDRVPLPTDFLREAEEDALWLVDGEGRRALPKAPYDLLVTRYGDASGAPAAYAFTGRYFRVRPVPDGAYKLLMTYYARDDELTANIENRWLRHAPDWLIGETGALLANRLGYREAAAAFALRAARGKAEVVQADAALRWTNRPVLVAP